MSDGAFKVEADPLPWHPPATSLFPQLTVQSAHLRAWANRAQDAARDISTGATHAGQAKQPISDSSGVLQSSNAALEALGKWSSLLGRLQEAVNGYGGKLTHAARAYDDYDYAAADLFAPERMVPHQGQDGGTVAT